MKLLQLVSILLFLSTTLCTIEKSGSVYKLTDSTYDQFISEHEAVFVKIYAPWCIHSKNVAPEFSQAAEMADEMEDLKVEFAELDATTETETAEKLSIEGYPTLLFFQNKKKSEYDGERIADSMIQWLSEKMVPKIKVVTSKSELDEILREELNQVVIVYLGAAEGEVYATFSILSNEVEQSGVVFLESQSEELLQHYNPRNKLLILKKFDEERVELEPGADTLRVQEFIRWNKVPMVMEMSMSYADAIFTDQVPCLFLFLNGNQTDANEGLLAELHSAAKTMFGTIYVASAKSNEELTEKMLEFLGITEEQLPTVFIIQPKEDNILKYSFNRQQINSATILEFFTEFINGKIEPYYQSEDLPEEDYIDNVKQLVGKNYKHFLQTEHSKYLLIKFYANWCPHSQKLKPIYSKLAAKIQQINSNKIIMAEIEATLNEVEDQVIEGVPTIILYKPNGEKAEFNDKLKEAALAHFLKTQMGDDWIDVELDQEDEEQEDEEQEDEEQELPNLEDMDQEIENLKKEAQQNLNQKIEL